MIRFNSLTRKEVCYKVDRASRTFTGYENVSDGCQEYLTYGDGATQHSPDTGIAKENIVDFLASLAFYLHEYPGGTEEVAGIWPSRLYGKSIDFYMGLKFKEGKEQWYSKTERKVVTSKTKQYDRRWEKVEDWMDGSIDSVLRLVRQSYWTALEVLAAYIQIRDRFGEIREYHPGIDGFGFGLKGLKDKTDEQWINVEYSFRCVDHLIEAHNLQDRSKKTFQSLEYNWLKGKREGEGE